MPAVAFRNVIKAKKGVAAEGSAGMSLCVALTECSQEIFLSFRLRFAAPLTVFNLGLSILSAIPCLTDSLC